MTVDGKIARIHLWRVGRSEGRHLHVQLGDQPAMTDPYVGTMDSAELAYLVVNDHNDQVCRWLDAFRSDEKHLIPGVEE